MHDVAWRGKWICVRSKDAQKQLARTSLSVFFALSRSDFRIEYVAFTLLTRGNSESDKSLNKFWIARKRKMTKKRQQSIDVSSFHYKIY